MHKRIAVLLFCLLPLALGNCKKQGEAQKPQEEKKDVVLEAGNYKLSNDDLTQFMLQLPMEQKAHYATMGQQGKEDFVKEFADKQLLIMAAKDQKYSDKPKVGIGISMAENSILYSAFYRAEVLDKVVPETEIKQYYDQHKDRFVTQEEVKVRHIMVTPTKEQAVNNTQQSNATNEEEAKKKILDIAKQLKEGADFSEMARKFSEDQSAVRGGEMDWFGRGNVVKQFEDAAFSLSPGQIAGPFQTQFGFHIVQLIAKRGNVPFSYDQVRNEIQNQLASARGEQVKQVYDKLIADLKVKYPEKINTQNIK